MTSSFFARPSTDHQTLHNECDYSEYGREVDLATGWHAGQRDGGGGCRIYESVEARKGKRFYSEDSVSNHIQSRTYASNIRGDQYQAVSTPFSH